MATRLLVDPARSEIRLRVYRDGPLARFGHNHVIVGPVRGEIRDGDRAADSGFRLEVPVDALVVDPPAARAEEGEDFASDVSDEARRGTRENMLGPALLDAGTSPVVSIESLSLTGPRWNPTVLARVTVRDASRTVRFPAAVADAPDGLTVIASFRIGQSDFGLAPFSVLGGGLLVRDAIDVRLRIVARRAP
jgi:hypothetical protein